EPIAEIPEELADNFEALEEITDEWEEDEEEEDIEGEKKPRVYSEEELRGVKDEIQSLKMFSELAKSIYENSKGKRLLTALKRGFKEAKAKGGAEKAIIFTESRRTQEYLQSILESTVYKGKIVLF